MTKIQHEVVSAKRRLWTNRWLHQWGWVALYCTIAWWLVWIADRLFAMRWPMGMAAAGAAGLSVIISLIWFIRTREHDLTAAAALDVAAGLRERVSTSLAFTPTGQVLAGADGAETTSTQDPFAAAVTADAERALAGLSARKFIPLRWSRSLSFSAVMLLAALISMLLPEFDLLKKNESRTQASARQAELQRVRNVVAKPVSAIQQIAEKSGDPEIAQQAKEFENAMQRDPNADADVVRREAVKQLDKLQDAMKQKIDTDRFKAFDETKKKLSQIGEPNDPKAELSKLMENMASGDFEQAQNEAKKLQEQLAKRAREGKLDPQKSKEMQKQLNELAQKLQKAAEDKQSTRDLQNAGLKKEDIKEVLQAFAKKDKKQVEKAAKELAERLKEKGVTEEQIKKLAEKIQQRKESSKQCNSMGQKMADAAKQLDKGNTEAAADKMGEAAEQLSEMEQMEQSLNEMDGQMAQLEEARDQLSKDGEKDGEKEGEGQCNSENNGKCGQCKGTGFRKDGAPCPHCNGSGKCDGGGQCNGNGSGNGKGKGGAGRGSAPRDRGDPGDFAFKNSKEKTKSAKGGRIIGQQFVKGEQLKGKSDVELMDVTSAAEIEAADALNKDRVPRMYRKGVKNYFDRLGEGLKDGSGPADPKAQEKKPADQPAEKPPTEAAKP
jgi:hypothetical protein